MSQKKLIEIKSLIEGAEVSLQQAKKMLASLVGESDKSLLKQAEVQGGVALNEQGRVIEGVFDGQQMIGPDGKQYSVPANYASKSKLVEGDMLKLTIDPRGNFIYKQIGPIERSRVKGKLTQDEKTGEWRVLADNKAYKVLLASVTYFKGESGNDVVIMVPRDKSSTWAAIENIIKNIEAPPVVQTETKSILPNISSAAQPKPISQPEDIPTDPAMNSENKKQTEDDKLQPLGGLEISPKEITPAVQVDEFGEDSTDEFEKI